ncbi:MAG: IS30 family transposase [Oscillospiraceae bacterium]|nr:IS30 family transposase [Oscillospiraceae bacterium]
MRHFKHLTENDRLIIESMLNQKRKPEEIADRLGFNKSTIYRELNRGRYTRLSHDYIYYETYSPDIAHERYRQNLKNKGPALKIGDDHKLADYIEHKILHYKYSPGAILGEIKINGLVFDTTISISTLYSYISKGVFLRVTNKDLPNRGKQKKQYRRIRQSRPSKGDSIEKRPHTINNRIEFGHWEMDLLEGTKKSKSAILVLTERMTRIQINEKIPNKKSASVIQALQRLKKRYGKRFAENFKSITVDNGSEFQNCLEMEKYTKIYYCHPYSSWERGSNENQNRMIRRHFPKGTNFDNVTKKSISQAETWLNNYPRKIFGYKSANEIYSELINKTTVS